MSRVILTTVGTSLSANSRSEGVPAAELLRCDPRRACAEANVLHHLLLQPGDRVELLHTETEDCNACAQELEAWLRERQVDVVTRAIPGFTNPSVALGKGLRSLVRLLSASIRMARHSGDEPVLNALGGFKPQIVYATLVGALFGIANVYIAGGGDELQVIPPLPVSWDFGLIDEYSEILLWLDADLRTVSEAQSRLQSLPLDIRETLTEADNDGYITLSALGQAYFDAYRLRVDEETGTLLLSTTAAETYTKADPSTKDAFDAQLRRLRVPGIRRGGSETLDRENSDVNVFPRGRVDQRIFWYEDADGSVRVLELTRHGKQYDAFRRKGVRKLGYALTDVWKPWP